MATSQVQSIYHRGTAPTGPPLSGDKEFLRLAFERFHLSEEAEAEVRRDALEDFRFKTGDQWDRDIFASRQKDARPCLTMNRLRQFTRMVTNEQRQQRPAVQINPVGDEADVQTAEVLQGLCRHVEVNSDAEIAYDTAFEHMATGGFGYYRIITDYVDDESDDQDIFIERIKNPFSVYVDPRAVKPDYSDALYYFIIDDMPTELYKATYPRSALASIVEFTSVGDQTPGWVTNTTVRVAEYFYVELNREKVKGGRDKIHRKVQWAKINAIETLEERDIPCRWIPIVPVLGDDDTIDGRRQLVGLVRDAKDPQRMYNFQISAAAEMIALAPKAPFIVAEGQLENHESQWEQANRRNFSTMTYKPISSATGQPVAPPQRQTAEPPIQAMSAMIRQADNDLKACTGIYDASLGQQGPEQSGKAVLLRQKQSDIANLNFTDNLARSIRFTGRVLLDMFPRVYTKPQVRRIIKPDNSVQQVAVYNSTNADYPDDMAQEMGVAKVYDIGVGRYDVSVSVGPNYQSKRQEAVASQVALISAYPAIMPIAGDLLVRNMDWPQAQQIADRMKKMLPAQLHDDPGGDPAAAMQQQQAQMMQMQQQNQLLLQAMQHQNEIINRKMIESQSKENVALIDNLTKLNVARITASKDQDIASTEREMEMFGMAHDSAHEAASQAVDAFHDRNAQFRDQTHEQGMSQMEAGQDQQAAAQQQAMQAPPAGGQPQVQQPGGGGPPGGGQGA